MAIHKKMKGSSRGHFLRQSATSRFLSPARPLCLSVCREQRRLFLLGKVLWPDGEEIVRAKAGGAVTGVDLLRQGRIRIWDGEENGKKAVLPSSLFSYACIHVAFQFVDSIRVASSSASLSLVNIIFQVSTRCYPCNLFCPFEF